MRLRCGAICLIALFVAFSDQESNQERGASKQLAPGVPYAHLLTDLWRFANARTGRQAVRYGERQRPEHRSGGLLIDAQVADAPRTVPEIAPLSRTRNRNDIIVAQGFPRTTSPSSGPCNDPAVFY